MRWCFLVLLIACGDDDARAPLSCQEADSEYSEARYNDVDLRDLARCQQDDECALWEPTLTCDGTVHLRDCSMATNVINVQVARLRNEELSAPVCERIPADCNIGVSCPKVRAACVDGLCTARAIP